VKTAALIIAHQDVEQVQRLADRLDCEAWVHLDANASPTIRDALTRSRSLRPVEPAVRVKWGHHSLLTAVLRGLAAIQGDPDHVLVLSGQTYPIKSPTAIRDRLERDVSYVRHNPLPIPAWGPQGGLDRLRRYWVLGGKRSRSVPILRRRLPADQMYGGETWMILSRRARNHVLDRSSGDDRLLRAMRSTLLPEEIYIQTVMGAGGGGRVENDALHYLRWTGKSSPELLGIEDLAAMRDSPALFARKFVGGASVLDAVDEQLLR
jgi:Core-2/I-Branching enzyme